MKKLKVVSLFAGAGGMDKGFVDAGFDIVWANDIDKDAVETYKVNIGDHIKQKDISKVDNEEIPDDIDVIIGGFPCQGFSVANTKRNMKDKRNFLYKEMLRIIEDKKPKFFLAENVKGILSMEKGRVIEMIENDFNELGYEVKVKLLNAADFGVPQARERVFIMGNNVDKENVFPEETHADLLKANPIEELFLEGKQQYVTTEEAIGHLSDVKLRDLPFKHHGETIQNHIAYTNVSEKFFARKYKVDQADICDYLKEWRKKAGISVKKIDELFGYRHTAGHWFRKDNNSGSIPKPEDWWGLKELLGFDDKYDKQVTEFVEKEIVFEQSLRITNWDRPSDTITATGPEIHVNKKRRLSVRECAILQTFPNDYIFQGSLNSQYRQVGNAVPVLLAKKIAECIKTQIHRAELVTK
ncbi:DNA cytosine methyltransferase [Pseudalkalibacillus caeni]|uniref:Cytosine-specific methyltransferase n=1 Tax=Exobacillus caeni TaxID=2574798 RepID=A0A5R9F7J1_9BACL|nr:DNA cytosine methyltransferase [Pseudalkalibacillus caeni]TLS36474.1 DNA cytosine methyltransferase [Pseudalkalibacillus caeni]